MVDTRARESPTKPDDARWGLTAFDTLEVIGEVSTSAALPATQEVKPMKPHQAVLMLLPLLTAAAQLATALLE